jgi:LysR family positive regulator for ilvC
MDTQQLTLFLSLSNTLHFGKTSQLMHMSPSAVSRALQRIEDEVGEQLFQRDSRRVNLTRAGRKFQVYAHAALNDWHDFNQRLRQDANHLSGEVAVFCSVTAVYSVLADILGPFRRQYPDIEITLHTGDQADAIDHLLSGAEDVAITARPDQLPASLQFQTLAHSPLLFIYPSAPGELNTALSEARNRPAGPDFEKFPFIISERGQARVQLDRWFATQRIKPRFYSQVSGNEAIVSMVALGFGMGVVPDLVLKYSPLKDKVRVLDVQPPLTPFAVGLCARTERLANPLVQAFWGTAGAAYQPLQ